MHRRLAAVVALRPDRHRRIRRRATSSTRPSFRSRRSPGSTPTAIGTSTMGRGIGLRCRATGTGGSSWAHGFHGSGLELTVDHHPLQAFLVANGYSWAASSYSKNDYDVAQGVKDTHSLTQRFNGIVGRPDRTYLTGASMGGHITAGAIEQYPRPRSSLPGSPTSCAGSRRAFTRPVTMFSTRRSSRARATGALSPPPRGTWVLHRALPVVRAHLGGDRTPALD